MVGVDGHRVEISMGELRELLTLKGRIISAEEYIKSVNFVEKEVLIAILGLKTKGENEDVRTN